MEYKVVVVDDEVELTTLLKIELEELNPDLHITCFSTGYEALADVMKGEVDLVLTDIAMPDMDGYELYSRLKENDESLPVIMMTGFGYDPDHVVVRTKQTGSVDVVPKPFQYERLEALIMRRIMERVKPENFYE